MTEKRVLAWHGDPDLKENTILRMKDHAEQDRFIRGTYLTVDGTANEWGGCLHGCLTAENLAAEKGMSVKQWRVLNEHNYYNINWHRETERFFGIPAIIGSMLDGVYEDNNDLPPAEVAVQLLEAIPVGADLRGIDLWDEDEELLLEDALEILRNAPVPNQEEGQ